MNNDFEARLIRLEKLAQDQAAQIASLQNSVAGLVQSAAAQSSQIAMVASNSGNGLLLGDTGAGIAAGDTAAAELADGTPIDATNPYATDAAASKTAWFTFNQSDQTYYLVAWDC